MESGPARANIRRRELQDKIDQFYQRRVSPQDEQKFDIENRERIEDDEEFMKRATLARNLEFDQRFESGRYYETPSSDIEEMHNFGAAIDQIGDLYEKTTRDEMAGISNRKGLLSGMEVEKKLNKLEMDSSPEGRDIHQMPSFIEFLQTIPAWGGFTMRDTYASRGDAIRAFYTYRTWAPMNPRFSDSLHPRTGDKKSLQLSTKFNLAGRHEGNRYLNPYDPGMHLWFFDKLPQFLRWWIFGWMISLLLLYWKKRIKHAPARKRSTRRWFFQQAALAQRSEFLWSMWNEFAMRGKNNPEMSVWQRRLKGSLLTTENWWILRTFRYAKLFGFWLYVPSFMEYWCPLPYYGIEPRVFLLGWTRVIPRWAFKFIANPSMFGVPSTSLMSNWNWALPRYQTFNKRLKRTSGPLYFFKQILFLDTLLIFLPKFLWAKSYHQIGGPSNTINPYLKSMNAKAGPENTFFPGHPTPNNMFNWAKDAFRSIFPIPVLPSKTDSWTETFKQMLTPFPRYRSKLRAMSYDNFLAEEKNAQRLSGKIPVVVNRLW